MEAEEDKQNLRAKTIENKLKERNNSEKTVSTHEYYGLALALERKLVKMNLILTVASIIIMIFEILYGLAVWNINYDMQLLFVEYIILRSLVNIMLIKRWLYLIQNREASHPMNSVCTLGMFMVVAICMLMSGPPPDSAGGVQYIIIVTMMDLILLVVTSILVTIMKRFTKRLFFSQELFDNYVTSLSIKLLKVLPIPADMEGEYIHFKEEEELRRQQAKLKRSKNNPPEKAAAVPGTPAGTPGVNQITAQTE